MKFHQSILLFLHFSVVFCKQKETSHEIDVPDLQFLASHLTLSECMAIVNFDVNYMTLNERVEKSTARENCFHILVKWICYIRAEARNTLSIVKNALKEIGRDDLINVLYSHGRYSGSTKVVRDAQAAGDSEDYEESATQVSSVQIENEKIAEKKTNKPSATSEKPADKTNVVSAQSPIKITIKTAGIVLVATIVITCCCTLCVRKKLANICDKLMGKKKRTKSRKFLSADTEDEGKLTRRFSMKKPRKKRKRAPSYEIVQNSPQNTSLQNTSQQQFVPVESEEQTTDCFRCYKKKKRRKTGKGTKK